MSLIHDALKKAQKPSNDSSSKDVPPFLNPEELSAKDKPKLNLRVIVLAVVLVFALLYLTYDRLIAGRVPKPGSPKIAPAIQSQTDQTKGAEIKRLKTEAVRAFQYGNIEEAWVQLSAASQLDERDWEVWNNMGLISKRKGDLSVARQFFIKSLEIKSDCAECLNNLAVLDMEEGNLKIAADRLHKAIAVKEDYPEAFFHLALISEQQGSKRLAVGFYKKFLELAKDAPPQVVDDVRRHVANMEIE